jgi:tryptophan synthase beta subunit
MKLLGATVVRWRQQQDAEDALAAQRAMRDWVANVDNTTTSSAPWPAHALPLDGARLQSVIGEECLERCRMLKGRMRQWAADAVPQPAWAVKPTPWASSTYINHRHAA